MAEQFVKSVKIDSKRANATIGNVLIQFPLKTDEARMREVLGRVLRPELKAPAGNVSSEHASRDGAIAKGVPPGAVSFDIMTRRQVWSKSSGLSQFEQYVVTSAISDSHGAKRVPTWKRNLSLFPFNIVSPTIGTVDCNDGYWCRRGDTTCNPKWPQ